MPVSFFFDDMPPLETGGAPGFREGKAEPFEKDPLVKRETLELVRAYYRITDPSARKRVFELTKAVANLSDRLTEG